MKIYILGFQEKLYGVHHPLSDGKAMKNYEGVHFLVLRRRGANLQNQG